MAPKLLQIIQDEILGSPEPLTPDSDLFEAGLDEPADLSRENFRTATKIAVLITSKR